MTARAWFSGEFAGGQNAGGDATLAMAREGGMAPEVIEALADGLKRQDGIAGFNGIWEQHLPAFRAFLAACSQWRVSAGRYLGLDYASADIAWRRLGIECERDDFRHMQVIEAEAARLMNGGDANAPLEPRVAGGAA